MKRFLFIATGCFLFLLPLGGADLVSAQATFEQWQQGQSGIGLNIYQHIYDNYDAIVQKVALQKTATEINNQRTSSTGSSLGFSESDIAEIVKNGPDAVKTIVEKYKKPTPENYNTLYQTIVQQYGFEKDWADYQLSLQVETGSLGLYSNGTLDDSDFDLVVDLNILDVIYFGSQAKTPVAYWGAYPATGTSSSSPSGGGSSSNTNGAIPGNGNTNGTGGTLNANKNGNPTTNTNQNSFNQNQNSVVTNANLNGALPPSNSNQNGLICLPAGQGVQFSDPAVSQEIQNQINTLNNTVSNNNTNSSANTQPTNSSSGANTNGAVVDNANLPLTEQSYTDISKLDIPINDSGFSSSQDEEGGTSWPCNSTFCIKISTKSGPVAGSGPSQEDNSIKAHTDYILQYLGYLNGLPLAVKKTTKQFLGIGFDNLKLSEFLNLKVVITKKPIWSPKKYTYTSDDPDKVRQDQNTTLLNVASNPCQRFTNSFASQIEDVNDMFSRCLQYLDDQLQTYDATTRMSIRNDTATVDMAPWVAEIITMRNSLASMLDAVGNKDDGILGLAKKFLQLKGV